MECTDSLLHVLYYVCIIQWLVTNNIIVMCMCQNKSISHVQYYTAWSEYITPNDSNSCWSLSLFCVIVVYLLEFKPWLYLNSLWNTFWLQNTIFIYFLPYFASIVSWYYLSPSLCLSVCLSIYYRLSLSFFSEHEIVTKTGRVVRLGSLWIF